MTTRMSALFMLGVMLFAASAAYEVRPTQKIADTAPPVEIAVMIPVSFGDWREDTQGPAQIVDPQQRQMIDKIYSATLMRTYVNSDGYRVMLSIAYGKDQSDSMQVHKPEVCYPAQGFEIITNRNDLLKLTRGVIPVRRLVAVGAKQRSEPISYWTMVGNTAVIGGIDKKMAQIRYGLKGQIPDGFLFRVSSIDHDAEKAFGLQDKFVEDLIGMLQPAIRLKISGLE